MAKIGIVEAFRAYGAKLVNPQWAVSAEIPGGIVMSLWESEFRKKEMRYVDKLSRWKGPGNNLFRKHLQLAYDNKLPVSLVIARASDPEAVRRGEDASRILKTFAIRKDLVGSVERLAGEEFEIQFSLRSLRPSPDSPVHTDFGRVPP
jgi:hypothetical protein